MKSSNIVKSILSVLVVGTSFFLYQQEAEIKKANGLVWKDSDLDQMKIYPVEFSKESLQKISQKNN